VTFRSAALLKAARDESCVRCGSTVCVVGAHYTGARRLAYGGGYGIKVHDFLIAHLCQQCHEYLDRLFREAGENKERLWEHSEEFLHLIAITLIRLFARGVIVVKGARR